MNNRKSAGRRKYARKYISKRKAVRRAKKSNFVKAVKAVIHQQTEDKIAYFSSGWNKFNSGITSTADMLSVLPAINTGSGSWQRIGNDIRGMSLNVKGHMRLDYLNVANQTNMTQVAVRLMVVTLKAAGQYTYDQYTNAPLNSLLEKGGSTSAFTGTIEDLYSNINSTVWTKHYDKVYYLSQSYINQPSGAGLSAIATDPKNAIKFFNIKVPCKKLLHYDPQISSNLFPVNFNPTILLGYSFLDNSTADTVNTRVGMQFVTTFKYEDL